MWEEIKGMRQWEWEMKIEGAGRKESLGKFIISLKGTYGWESATVPYLPPPNYLTGMAWHGMAISSLMRRRPRRELLGTVLKLTTNRNHDWGK
jgi:hypothetical protein